MLARYVYRHARYLALIIICILAVGINSFNSISRQEDPELTNFVGNITTFFPGATPDRVEALITRPLEDELRTIAEIKEIDSTSSSGVSFLGIRLRYSLSDGDLVPRRIGIGGFCGRSRCDAARYAGIRTRSLQG